MRWVGRDPARARADPSGLEPRRADAVAEDTRPESAPPALTGELTGALAGAAAEAAEARLVFAPADPGVPVAAPGAFQRRNFAVALSAAEAFLGRLDAVAVREAAIAVQVPGRLQVVARDPLTVVDGAHNPSGMAALVDALPEVVGERPMVAVVAVLDDKDAAAMLRA